MFHFYQATMADIAVSCFHVRAVGSVVPIDRLKYWLEYVDKQIKQAQAEKVHDADLYVLMAMKAAVNFAAGGTGARVKMPKDHTAPRFAQRAVEARYNHEAGEKAGENMAAKLIEIQCGAS